MGMIADLWGRLSLKTDKHSFDAGEKAIEGIKRGLEVFIGVEALRKVGEWIESTAEIGDHAVKAGQKIGVTTEAIQELAYAAKIADISQEELELSLGKLAKNLDVVATKGKGPAAEALQRLGIQAKYLKGESLDQNLELIAEKFAAMPDGVTKTALAMELFGKSGKNMIPLLNKGHDGIVDREWCRCEC